mmetsp:Transcript_28495/g.63034  ORF Transcript_28495/g.63034 Transcript_28495/m.63034 type:complete len:200 (-) Transcript_28495:697-1296(-)
MLTTSRLAFLTAPQGMRKPGATCMLAGKLSRGSSTAERGRADTGKARPSHPISKRHWSSGNALDKLSAVGKLERLLHGRTAPETARHGGPCIGKALLEARRNPLLLPTEAVLLSSVDINCSKSSTLPSCAGRESDKHEGNHSAQSRLALGECLWLFSRRNCKGLDDLRPPTNVPYGLDMTKLSLLAAGHPRWIARKKAP